MTGVADTIDRGLEFGIGPSFTRIGYDVRSRLFHWTAIEGYNLSGRVVVMSGATSGLGRAAAGMLVAAGATVEVIARNAERAERTCDALNAEPGAGSANFVIADTGDLVAMRSAAAELIARHPRIDVLIHNAGALDEHYARSPQGIETTVASQVVGPFLLTGLLLDALRAAAPSRVLWMASGGMYSQPLAVDDLELRPADYDGTTAYARAKRAQVTLAQLWAERLVPDRIVVHALHPGWADTPGVQKSLPTFRRVVGPLLRSPDQGADTLAWLAADDGDPLRTTGDFWLDRRPRSIHRLGSTRRSDTPAERRRLWEWCVDRSGFDPES
jgi:NAD(P)-dependent dehydrogenase (short-subunit alcohol dehydrogenase family)